MSVAACRSDALCNARRATLRVAREAARRRRTRARRSAPGRLPEGALPARSTGWFEAVTLNSSGGVAGGDRLDAAFAVGPGAPATFASQAAERFYRARPAMRRRALRTRIAVADGAARGMAAAGDHPVRRRARSTAGWRSSLRRMRWFLGVESLVFGRTAMGERVASLRLRRHDPRPPRRPPDPARRGAARRRRRRRAGPPGGGARRGGGGDTGACGTGRRGAARPPARRLGGARRPKPARAPGTACWSAASWPPTAPRCAPPCSPALRRCAPAARCRGCGCVN